MLKAVDSSWLKYFITFLAGCLLPLAFAPVDFYLLAVLSPAVLFYFFLSATPRQAAWLGWIFGLGYFAVGVSWVYVAIYVFGSSSIITSVLLTSVFISILAAYISLQGYLSIFFVRKFHIKNELLILLVIFPLFWVLLEWFRGWLFTGFPWINLGYSQTDSVLSGYAAVFGVYGISLLLALSSSLLVIAISDKNKKSMIAIFSIFVIWFGGYLLSQVDWTGIKGKPLKVSLVQGNVEQKNKWQADQVEKRKQRYLALTQQHWDSDLILWPENSLTLFYHDLKDDYLASLTQKAKEHDTDIILGLPVLDQKNKEYFSSLVVLAGSAKNIIPENNTPQFYHKSHLVPFGEYMPFASVLRGIVAFFDLPMSGFTPGKYEQNMLTAAGQKIAPTICYEDAFGEDVIRFLPEASLILNASNNAWYGDSFAPHQHVQISQMRALETGRDLMRVTTNGVSALINFKGEITARSPQFKAHVVTGLVQPRTGATPYVRWGNSLILALVFIGLMTIILLPRKNIQ